MIVATRRKLEKVAAVRIHSNTFSSSKKSFDSKMHNNTFNNTGTDSSPFSTSEKDNSGGIGKIPNQEVSKSGKPKTDNTAEKDINKENIRAARKIDRKLS